MPRYFIDTDDDETLVIDDEGMDLPDHGAARWQALDALPDMARDKMPDGDNRTFRVCARDERGKVVYSAEMKLQGGSSNAQWPGCE
ncbi:DUF6894 family protein [Bosea sp. PAMC 26642]|uniref:DUF6894 family protein n=1 Tax=Bosea sp. (strain PAMC 26642) TaxID=1792307 RepID=UPI00076FEE47|nr:hypothetical protein [Bosea sp. PAMC 26642]AMJ62287.1 hypothetical protein AXW83_20060 [Bosea sp. PAMC 26642]